MINLRDLILYLNTCDLPKKDNHLIFDHIILNLKLSGLDTLDFLLKGVDALEILDQNKYEELSYDIFGWIANFFNLTQEEFENKIKNGEKVGDNSISINTLIGLFKNAGWKQESDKLVGKIGIGLEDEIKIGNNISETIKNISERWKVSENFCKKFLVDMAKELRKNNKRTK